MINDNCLDRGRYNDTNKLKLRDECTHLCIYKKKYIN